MHFARVHVHVIVLVVDVVCLMLVLSGLVVLLAVFVQFPKPVFCSRRNILYIKLMAQTQPRREDVFGSLLESMKQAVEKKKEPNGTRPTKKPRDLHPLELGIPEARQCPTLEIKGDCTTIVDEQLVSRDTGQKRNILKRSKSAWRCWIFPQEAAATAGTDPTEKRTARSRSRLSSGSQEQEG